MRQRGHRSQAFQNGRGSFGIQPPDHQLQYRCSNGRSSRPRSLAKSALHCGQSNRRPTSKELTAITMQKSAASATSLCNPVQPREMPGAPNYSQPANETDRENDDLGTIRDMPKVLAQRACGHRNGSELSCVQPSLRGLVLLGLLRLVGRIIWRHTLDSERSVHVLRKGNLSPLRAVGVCLLHDLREDLLLRVRHSMVRVCRRDPRQCDNHRARNDPFHVLPLFGCCGRIVTGLSDERPARDCPAVLLRQRSDDQALQPVARIHPRAYGVVRLREVLRLCHRACEARQAPPWRSSPHPPQCR
jgi:hypothetical protein